MISLPQDWELLDVFGAEPSLSDPERPWAYNTLTFAIASGAVSGEVVIVPGYEEARIELRGGFRCSLFLRDVERIVANSGGRAQGVRFVMRRLGMGEVVLLLRPSVSLAWEVPSIAP